MDCACLVHKINGCYHYRKGVYVQIIITIDRRYFREQHTVPHENVYIPKSNLQKTLEITES